MKQEVDATPEELWEYCIKEYESSNFIVKKLIDNFYNKLNQLINILPKNGRLLEVGCGVAESSKRIYSKLNNQVFEASEFDERYISKLFELNLPFKIQQESVYELKREENSYDCIFLLEVLEHLEFPEQAKKELHRVSNKYIIISVPNEPIWRISNMLRGKYLKDLGNTPGHINHYSTNKLINFLSSHFKVIRILKPFPWQIVLAEKNK